MHFSLTAQYTSQALNSIMDDPKTNRYEAVKKLVEAAGSIHRDVMQNAIAISSKALHASA